MLGVHGLAVLKVGGSGSVILDGLGMLDYYAARVRDEAAWAQIRLTEEAAVPVPLPKSAFQQPGARPTARRHYDTIRVDELPVTGERGTIVATS